MCIPKPNDVTCVIDQTYWSQWRWGIEEGAGRRGGGGGGGRGAEGAEGYFTWGWNWSNVLIPMKVRHWRGGGRGEGGEGGRREGGREGRVGHSGQKEILPGGQNWSNVLILMKVRHWGGGGREGRAGEGRMEGREILPGGCGIDQMYWSKWRWGIEEGVHLQTWRSGAPYPSAPPPMGAGARGRGAGGRI